MKKLSEYQDDDALDLLADIIEPVGLILADKEVVEGFKSKNRISAIKPAIKNHKKELIEVMARLDGIPVEEYRVNVLSLPVKLLEILNDKELMDFFTSQAQGLAGDAGGPATETTEDND